MLIFLVFLHRIRQLAIVHLDLRDTVLARRTVDVLENRKISNVH